MHTLWASICLNSYNLGTKQSLFFLPDLEGKFLKYSISFNISCLLDVYHLKEWLVLSIYIEPPNISIKGCNISLYFWVKLIYGCALFILIHPSASKNPENQPFSYVNLFGKIKLISYFKQILFNCIIL